VVEWVRVLSGPRKETLKAVNHNSGSSTCLSRFAGGLPGTSASSSFLACFLVVNALLVAKGLLIAGGVLVLAGLLVTTGFQGVLGVLVVAGAVAVAGLLVATGFLEVLGFPVVAGAVAVLGVVGVAAVALGAAHLARLAMAWAVSALALSDISERTFFACRIRNSQVLHKYQLLRVPFSEGLCSTPQFPLSNRGGSK